MNNKQPKQEYSFLKELRKMPKCDNYIIKWATILFAVVIGLIILALAVLG